MNDDQFIDWGKCRRRNANWEAGLGGPVPVCRARLGQRMPINGVIIAFCVAAGRLCFRHLGMMWRSGYKLHVLKQLTAFWFLVFYKAALVLRLTVLGMR